MNGDVLPPWERQPQETGRRFAAFTVYRDAEAYTRSTRKVALTLGVSEGLVRRWSAAEGWVARVAAWDMEQDRIKRVARSKEIEDMGRRQAAAGALMQAKGLGKLRATVERTDRDGAPVDLKPGQRYVDVLSVSEATRLVEAGVRLERIGRGEGDPYVPPPVTVTTNIELQISVATFMRENPTRVGAVVEVLEQLAAIMDAKAETASQPDGAGTEL